ncbi:MAG: hypothetical protein EP347_07435 [Alphaproteobacteria bacterium]|nr:MAG: hypothetical protein EP347_07435 [Alphaproteobacteria bacterium]
MERILILGPCGAGKSTLAASLGEALCLPVIHLDKLYWQPGWVESTPEDFSARLEAELKQPSWIVDGNYSNYLEKRLKFSDTLIHLDYPRRIHVGRVIKRVLTKKGVVRPDMGPDCPEKFDWEFLVYTWNFRREKTPKTRALIESVQATKKVLTFTHPRQTKAWLQSLNETRP